MLEAVLSRACVAAQLEAAAAWRPVHAALRSLGGPRPQRPRRDATRRLIALWDYQARARIDTVRSAARSHCKFPIQALLTVSTGLPNTASDA